MTAPVTREDIRRRIGEPDFSRGEAYFLRKQVKSASLNANRSLAKGQVRGSQRTPYAQKIVLQWSSAGHLQRVVGACSCPVGSNCKHVAAVMLTLLPELNAAEISASERGPSAGEDQDELGNWLDRLEQARDMGADRPVRSPPPMRLYYVLRPARSGALEIELHKVRILKDGGLSRSPQRLSLAAIQPGGGQAFLEVDDVGIIGKLQHLRRRGINSATGLRIHASDLGGDSFTALIQEIIATGRAKAFSIGHPDLSWQPPVRGQFAWRELPDGTQQLVVMGPGGRELATLPLIPPLYVDRRDGRCGPLLTDATGPIAHALVTMPPVPPKAARDIVKALTRLEGANAPLPRHIDVDIREGIKPTPVLQLFAIEGQPGALLGGQRYGRQAPLSVTVPMLRVMFDYSGQRVGLHDRKDPEQRDGDKLVVIRRDDAFEAAALARLGELGDYGIAEISALDQELYGIKGRRPHDFMFEVENETHLVHELDYQALEFAQNVLPELTAAGWIIETDASWPYRFHDGPLTFKAGVESDRTDWFAFALSVEVAGHSLDLLPIVLRVIEMLPLDANGQLEDADELAILLEDMTLFLDLPDGSRVPVDGEALVPLVRACLAAHALLGGFHVGEAAEARRLAEALEGCGIRFQGGEALLELGRKLQALTAMPEVPPPPSLSGELRHYQQTGYGWLQAVSETGFGGVLADDMGLGKTIQALAILCDRHLEQACDRPSLLVAPTSLVANWQREAARFAPGLRLLILHGAARQAHFAEIPDHHLVVTTYPLLHRDHESLFAHEYEMAILDEAQAVKNPAAASAKRIREIKARFRLALTGTPIENNLQELWALYDWVVPGLLGNRKTFNELFRRQIETHGDGATRQRLATRIRPFLLRRTKQQVAADLPPKTEINELVTLGGDQRDLYEAIRVAMDARVREAIASRGVEATRITVLDALLKLRQVCCDPGLVKLDSAKTVKASAKRARLLDMLDELLAEGRKVLVFSQFVEMLRLIEKDASARGIDYAMLTGQTRKRQEQIERFQSGEVPLFLISLKAGGVGLNLTAADTVIIYDPWWNPAVERQAMDRAHRIGQDKPVFVYRLIAEGSVEAAIQEMQARKQALTDSLFEGTQGGGLGMDEADIQTLFAPLQ